MSINHSFSTLCDLTSFKPYDELKEFHHWEVYDKTKEYTNDVFKANYHNQGVKQYKYFLRIYKDNNSGDEKRYVVAIEYLTPQERDDLKLFCQCYHCTTYSPLRYIWPKNLCSCFKQDVDQMLSQALIDNTRNYMFKNTINIDTN